MIDILKKELQRYTSREDKFNHLRELLQIMILKIIHDTGFFKNLAFTGGTALRVLFDLRRFSEDLDFSIIDRGGYSLDRLSKALATQFSFYHLDLDIKARDIKVVQSVDMRFTKILQEMGISALAKQKLLVRIEIDSHPPQGGNIEVTPLHTLFMFPVTHYDLPSLYATKLHACFFRKYTKGRDFYDLLWYLTRKIEPNYTLLNNAIVQTQGGKNPGIDRNNFKSFLLKYLSRINFIKIRQDIERFLEDKKEAELLDKDSFIRLANQSAFW